MLSFKRIDTSIVLNITTIANIYNPITFTSSAQNMRILKNSRCHMAGIMLDWGQVLATTLCWYIL